MFAPTRWILAVVLAFALPAHAQIVKLSAADQHLLNTLAEDNLADIMLGRLAELRGSAKALRSFGRRMVDDHVRLEDDLARWATASDVPLPAGMGPSHHAEFDKLRRLSGRAFDAEYVQYIISEHGKELGEVERGAATAQNAGVRRLAAKAVPVIRDDLRRAQSLAARGFTREKAGFAAARPPCGSPPSDARATRLRIAPTG